MNVVKRIALVAGVPVTPNSPERRCPHVLAHNGIAAFTEINGSPTECSDILNFAVHQWLSTGCASSRVRFGPAPVWSIAVDKYLSLLFTPRRTSIRNTYLRIALYYRTIKLRRNRLSQGGRIQVKILLAHLFLDGKHRSQLIYCDCVEFNSQRWFDVFFIFKWLLRWTFFLFPLPTRIARHRSVSRLHWRFRLNYWTIASINGCFFFCRYTVIPIYNLEWASILFILNRRP